MTQAPSNDPATPEPKFPELVDRLSLYLNLPIAPEYRTGVVDNLERTAAIAQLVLDFPLPDTIEPASVFQP